MTSVLKVSAPLRIALHHGLILFKTSLFVIPSNRLNVPTVLGTFSTAFQASYQASLRFCSLGQTYIQTEIHPQYQIFEIALLVGAYKMSRCTDSSLAVTAPNTAIQRRAAVWNLGRYIAMPWCHSDVILTVSFDTTIGSSVAGRSNAH